MEGKYRRRKLSVCEIQLKYSIDRIQKESIVFKEPQYQNIHHDSERHIELCLSRIILICLDVSPAKIVQQDR